MSSIYPFVTEAYITDASGENRLAEVNGSQTVQLHVRFNRDMAQEDEFMPMVSFGPSEPYTDYVVHGDWISSREWVGTITIDPFINQGTNYIRIRDAYAADDHWLRTGTDAARFAFDITRTSAEALTLQGNGGSNLNYINWVQDDYETLAGFNLYRATQYDPSLSIKSQSFTKINTTIISNDVYEYTDYDVEQGLDYYYYFTVVDTDFNESEPSNVIVCTPIDEESPIIVSSAIGTSTIGNPVLISATVTDNVAVTEVNLMYKMRNSDVWQQAVMRNTVADTYQAVIPSYELEEGTLEYCIVAYDGTNVSYSGTELLPNVITIVGIVPVESVYLDEVSVSMLIGNTTTLTATVLPDNATDKALIWHSSDENIATVADGIVSAVGLSITEESVELLVGDTFILDAVVSPDNATDKTVIYETGDDSIATVDDLGHVVAVGVGETDIKVSTNDASDLIKICHVMVSPILVQTVSLTCVSRTIEIGDEYQLTAIIYPANATDQSVVWTSNNDRVAIVDDGIVSAVGVGQATISVTTTDGSNLTATCNITIL